MGVFREIVVSFLQVGHTHIDIDQVFSRFAVYLRKHNAFTLEQMSATIRQAYTPTPFVNNLETQINWSKLCEQEKCLTNPPEFRNHYFFKFHKVTGRSRASSEHFRTTCSIKSSECTQWTPLNNGEGFIRFAPDLRNTPPTNIKNFTETTRPVEVDKCIDSSEMLIRDHGLVTDLRHLRYKIFRDAPPFTNKFTWDLSLCVENRGDYVLGEESMEPGEMDDEPDPVDSAIQSELSYDVGRMVAVKAENLLNDAYWIARIIGIDRCPFGSVEYLHIEWFEEVANGTASGGTGGNRTSTKKRPVYRLCMLNDGSDVLKQKISPQTVLVTFNNLTRKNHISKLDEARIISALRDITG